MYEFSEKILSLSSDFIGNVNSKYFIGKEIARIPLYKKVLKIKIKLQIEEVFHLRRLKLYGKGKVLVEGEDYTLASLTSSSVFKDDESYSSKSLFSDKGIFHSKKEKSPWVEVLFTNPVYIEEIELTNFSHKYAYRSYSLAVFIQETYFDEFITVFDGWHFKKSLEALVYNSHPIICDEEEKLVCHFYISVLFGDVSKSKSLFKTLSEKLNSKLFKLISENANKALNIIGYGFNQHGLIRPFGTMSNELLSSIISDVSQLIDVFNHELGMEVFATSGTLLGLFRSGTLIPHDDDIDLSYISKFSTINEIREEREFLINFLSNKGYRVRKSEHVQIQCELNDGIFLDLFPSWQVNDNFHISPLPTKDLLAKRILPLDIINYLGFPIPVPKDINCCLELNYGSNWRELDTTWRFDWAQANKDYSELIR